MPCVKETETDRIVRRLEWRTSIQAGRQFQCVNAGAQIQCAVAAILDAMWPILDAGKVPLDDRKNWNPKVAGLLDAKPAEPSFEWIQEYIGLLDSAINEVLFREVSTRLFGGRDENLLRLFRVDMYFMGSTPEASPLATMWPPLLNGLDGLWLAEVVSIGDRRTLALIDGHKEDIHQAFRTPVLFSSAAGRDSVTQVQAARALFPVEAAILLPWALKSDAILFFQDAQGG